MVNEFGTFPIDVNLVEAAVDRIVSLVGGCACCSYGEDLVSSLVMLAALEPRPDHLLLEASGVAFPGAIAGTVGLLMWCGAVRKCPRLARGAAIQWRRKRWVVIVSPKLRYAEDDPTVSRRAARSSHSVLGGLYLQGAVTSGSN